VKVLAMEGWCCMKLRRWGAGLLIGSYLLLLSWGIVGHALKIPSAGNTLGYFVVWDMFCGWQAFDNRTHFIAEDSAGNYYRVREPWGAFQPFGHVDRVNYDVSNNLAPRHIRNVLAHTDHPPIDRVYVVQEIWPKQFNVPDRLWSSYFHEPKDQQSYFNLRAICAADGTLIESNPDWYVAQGLKSIADNPRLRTQAQGASPFYNTFFNPRMAVETNSSFSSSDGGLSN